MSDKSNNQGRAYEYAWINALYQALCEMRKVFIVENSSLEANRRAWNTIDTGLQERFKVSANAAVATLLELEPMVIENNEDVLQLEFQKDLVGGKGDVRDIVLKRNTIQWEIGLSIKHNHDAVKHSRLSHILDFGKEWFNVPCSHFYWKDIKPIFDYLKEEKKSGRKWSNLVEKEKLVYIPLLKAFMDEIQRVNKTDSLMPRKMVEYLIGMYDYYKIVSHDSRQLTVIHTYNMHGTLNKRSRTKVSVMTIPVVQLPTELIALKLKSDSNNTVEMYLNNGWQLNFRIHNASSKVEPSLKFDVQFIGMPMTVLRIDCNWGDRINV